MRVTSTILSITASFFVCLASAQQNGAKKDEAKPSSTPERSFGTLLAQRDTLSKDISDLDTDIYWVNDALAKIEDEKNSTKPTKESEAAIKQSMNNAHLPADVTRDCLSTILNDKTHLKEQKQKEKEQLDAELEKRADVVAPQQHFKLEMSLIFAVLVAGVIAGFFVIAIKDQQVRQEIFAGQAGIQFVTLFSLVIAIILFGIIDILEGKELAALLGGLSGYILGRSSGTAKPPAVQANPPTQTPSTPTPSTQTPST